MRILLLEDNYAYRISIKEYLESLGYIVDDTSNGAVACDKIRKKPKLANSYHDSDILN